MISSEAELEISGIKIGIDHPSFFIADIAANHDGSLSKAKELIWLASEAGANAAKFQHFQADSIVSDYGFKSLGEKKSHQAGWGKSVYQIYKEASVSLDWTLELKDTCQKAGIVFFTSPYSIELVDHINDYVPAYKIGSGDITWHEIIKHIASKNKPYMLATGASNINEVKAAVEVGFSINPQIALLQCNTDYTANIENLKYINLNVLNTYKNLFPNLVLGLSDHSFGYVSVLGAIALGARIIEKHFTDNTSRIGPDHAFSMDPKSWKEMVLRARELESCLGGNVKKVEFNEKDTRILQRRAIRLISAKKAGSRICIDDLKFLRPCPDDALSPNQINDVIGKTLREDKESEDYLKCSDLQH